jgi:hypothetical protein
MKQLYMYVLLLGSLNLNAQTSPSQISTGPGSNQYTHQSWTQEFFSTTLTQEGYWLFEPASPKPDSSNLIIFNHGYGVYNPGPYGAWIEHLVKKGNTVIFTKYQSSTTTLSTNYTPNAVTAVQQALNELATNPNRVKPRLNNIAIIGHSFGGVVTSNMVTAYSSYGIPKPKCFMLCQPGTGGFPGRLNDYTTMPSDYKALLIVGDEDLVVGDAFAREIMNTTPIPTHSKNLITHFSDRHGFPYLDATHNEPLAKNIALDGGTFGTVITGGYLAAKTDAIDYYCYWKLADALLECSFYGTNCNSAFGATPEQKYMGQWSDGAPVRPLRVEPENSVFINEHSSTTLIQPNPVQSYFELPQDLKFESIELYSSQGQKIAIQSLTSTQWDVSALASGIYHLKLNLNDHSSQFIKFIKQ